ncbi:MAG TPA: HNH endonuclease [Casimicrobiaceae bacterium]|nr:HNH endonuclease [Casimicrobiaceae bacterium]
MKIWIAVTDRNWYEHLLALRPEEVNFWQPSGSRTFRALEPGEPFLFKLHSPENYIVGGGFFVRYSALPASLAWEAFERKNGVDTLDDLVRRVRKYRADDRTVDPVIGCSVLAEPFFLPRSEWVPVPPSWASNIVQGKSYDSESEEGQSLWAEVSRTITIGHSARDADRLPTDDADRRFGAEFLTRGRLGQGAFRVLVTDAYLRKCAVTGEKTLPVLEAAHIKPYALEGPHSIENGILLRSDLHKLFDLGYVTITPDLTVEVSPRLRVEWENGREYYAYHGKELQFRPPDPRNQPSTEFLRWHNERQFRA